MKNLVTIFEDLFNNHEGFQGSAADFSRAMKTEQFKFLVDAVFMIRGQMAEDMFSYRYTNSDPIEKDVAQRTYYNVNQILDFLINPQRWVKKKSKLKQAYADLASKVTPSRKEGKK